MNILNQKAWLPCLLCVLLCFTGCGNTNEVLTKENVNTNEVLTTEQVNETMEVIEEDQQDSQTISKNMYTEVSDTSYSLEAYYYSQLSDEEQIIYNEIYSSIEQWEETNLSTLSEEMLDKIYVCVLNDHPEIFYCTGYKCVKHTRNEQLVKLTFKATYCYSKEETEVKIKELEEQTQRILSQIPTTSGDYNKIKTLYDIIINETEYVLDSPDNQNICSVLLNHQSVCQGYAKTTQYLLNQLGINATLVSGTVSEGGPHAWNLVMSNNSWYYLDTTWGDVDYQSTKASETEQISKEVLPINYDYFLITSDTLNETHMPDKLVALPNCVASEDNYYVHEGLYLTGLDTSTLQTIFDNAYASSNGVVTFKCANEAVYESVINYLLEEQHAFDYINAKNSVTFYNNDRARTLCFWL